MSFDVDLLTRLVALAAEAVRLHGYDARELSILALYLPL
jgi:hypothetical protein